MLGDNALFIIGDNGHVLCGGKGAQLGYVLGIQLFLVQSLAGAAVDDLAALFIQPQFLCQRQHARGGTAGCQHDGDTLCNCGIQCGAGAGCNFFLAVGQGAIQIQCQNFDLCHIKSSQFI